ncbi:MAG TPA: TlpA disulfide reductase family protein [Flavisolibacter sp.]|nr:TlpA disulfide reductase family protein [Flavisolibacter sp.]
MNYRFLFFLVVLSIGTTWKAICQTLKVGDKLPEVVLKNVVHYASTDLSTKDLRGKYVILEFWSSHCVVCIKGFPKLVELQQMFKDKLQIVAVSPNAKEQVQKILEKVKVAKNIIPFVSEDSLLRKLIPKNYVPWVVWVDSGGIIRHQTDGEWLTKDNIAAFVSGNAPQIVQNEYIPHPKKAIPLIAEADGKWLDKIDYYSYLAHCIKGKSIHHWDISDSVKGRRITRNCLSVADLLKEAFSEGNRNRFAYKNQLKLQLQNSYPFVNPAERDTAWNNKYSFSYEIAVPPNRSDQVYKMMQEDLQRMFNLRAEVRVEKITCLVLTRKDSTDRLRTKGGRADHNLFVEQPVKTRFLRNVSFEEFVAKLRQVYHPFAIITPFINATGYTGKVDIEISENLLNPVNRQALKTRLHELGLDLVEQLWETEVLIITDKRRRE